MKTQRLLTKARPASSAICPGCERDCVMPVHVLPAEGKRPVRAFISCDKRDDTSNVPVDFPKLEQWQATGELIATALANLLGFSELPKAVGSNQWHIGTLKGVKHNSSIKLLAGDGLTLSLAGRAVPLAEVLTIEENALALDKAALIRLVDNPAGDAEAEDLKEIEVSDFGIDEFKKYPVTNAMPSVSASEIRWKFTVIKSEDANEKWWKKMMRNASDNGLKECRVGGGKKGRGGSMWRPDLIAVWLVDRTDKKLEGNMSKNAARASLKKIAGYEETAEDLFPKDE